jgi:hypothetical protein
MRRGHDGGTRDEMRGKERGEERRGKERRG